MDHIASCDGTALQSSLLPQSKVAVPLVHTNYFPSPLLESMLFHVMTQHKGSLCRAWYALHRPEEMSLM